MNASETTSRLVTMTNQTCVIALDKTINHSKSKDYAVSAARMRNIGTRMCIAVTEVGATLPSDQRIVA